MLEGSPFEAFGRWVKDRRQAGFRVLDDDGGGSIDLWELRGAVESFQKSFQKSRQQAKRGGSRGGSVSSRESGSHRGSASPLNRREHDLDRSLTPPARPQLSRDGSIHIVGRRNRSPGPQAMLTLLDAPQRTSTLLVAPERSLTYQLLPNMDRIPKIELNAPSLLNALSTPPRRTKQRPIERHLSPFIAIYRHLTPFNAI